MSATNARPNIEGLEAPVALRATVAAIVAATDELCERHLDGEYGKQPSPLARGDARIWAAGVLYTVGSLNFLFDRAQVPHMRADELAAGLGVRTARVQR